jgi:hypothetical protein
VLPAASGESMAARRQTPAVPLKLKNVPRRERHRVQRRSDRRAESFRLG